MLVLTMPCSSVRLKEPNRRFAWALVSMSMAGILPAAPARHQPQEAMRNKREGRQSRSRTGPKFKERQRRSLIKPGVGPTKEDLPRDPPGKEFQPRSGLPRARRSRDLVATHSIPGWPTSSASTSTRWVPEGIDSRRPS